LCAPANREALRRMLLPQVTPLIVIRLLNEALATELVCVLRYKRHYFMAKSIYSEPVKADFMAHANEEMIHAERIAVESYR
ncbi:MAG: ferritin-like domain-containing protein, partial [Methylococcales bacterium]